MENKQLVKNILIVGGGFVGLTLAAKLLKTPQIVVNILENDSKKIEKFNKNEFGVYEPQLDEILKLNISKDQLVFISSLGTAMFDYAFICINTPKNENKRIEKQSILVDALLNNLKISSYIFLRSTVPVGTTTMMHNMIQNSSRKDIKIFYAPERTAEGVALEELDVLPQVLGSPLFSNMKKGRDALSTLGFEIVETSSSEAAEFVKLTSNIWRDSVFAISNELAVIAASMNLDIYEIVEKVNFKYPRANIPNPGPVGGPCLSKDTYLLLESVAKDLAEDSLIYKSRKTNEKIVQMAFNSICNFLAKNSNYDRIYFIGAAFKGKPRTNDFRNSLSQDLIRMIIPHNIEFKLWDPTMVAGDLLEYSAFLDADLDIKKSDIVVIGNNAEFIYSDKVLTCLENLPDSTLIVDLWGVTRNLKNINSQIYQLGKKV